MFSQVFDTAKKLFKEIGDDDVSGLAAELAYRMLLALFPFFIFLAALGGFIASAANIENPTERIMENLRDTLPSDAASVLETQLDSILSNQNGGLLTLGILGAVWGASAAMNTIIKALNRAYDVEETRPFWKKTPMALGLTVLAAVFFIGSFTVLIAGQIFAEDIGNKLGLGDVTTTALNILRIPFVILLLAIAMAFLYWAAPNAKLPFRWVSPGAIMFIVVWIAGTVGFSFYVANFATYNSTYGTLGGVVVLMIWLYLTSFIIVAGAELNAILQAKVEPEAMETPPGAREEGAVTASRGQSGRDRSPATNRVSGPKVILPSAVTMNGAAGSSGSGGKRTETVGKGTIALGMAIAGVTALRYLTGKRKDSVETIHKPIEDEEREEAQV